MLVKSGSVLLSRISPSAIYTYRAGFGAIFVCLFVIFLPSSGSLSSLILLCPYLLIPAPCSKLLSRLLRCMIASAQLSTAISAFAPKRLYNRP
jgi:hypothetical protein